MAVQSRMPCFGAAERGVAEQQPGGLQCRGRAVGGHDMAAAIGWRHAEIQVFEIAFQQGQRGTLDAGR
ncbi:hypothetical protein GY15_00925 [Delftia sp. 670]|nr:hypothetical protein GY15_00925 [Delftia sp. 670]